MWEDGEGGRWEVGEEEESDSVNAVQQQQFEEGEDVKGVGVWRGEMCERVICDR